MRASMPTVARLCQKLLKVNLADLLLAHVFFADLIICKLIHYFNPYHWSELFQIRALSDLFNQTPSWLISHTAITVIKYVSTGCCSSADSLSSQVTLALVPVIVISDLFFFIFFLLIYLALLSEPTVSISVFSYHSPVFSPVSTQTHVVIETWLLCILPRCPPQAICYSLSYPGTCVVNLDLYSDNVCLSGDTGPCSGYECHSGAMCIVRNNRPVCECPTCSEKFKPVSIMF